MSSEDPTQNYPSPESYETRNELKQMLFEVLREVLAQEVTPRFDQIESRLDKSSPALKQWNVFKKNSYGIFAFPNSKPRAGCLIWNIPKRVNQRNKSFSNPPVRQRRSGLIDLARMGGGITSYV